MANSDSDFEVRIEQRMFSKGSEAVIKKEHYSEWAQADAAFCAYRDLTKIPDSSILHVELIENRKTIVHKVASKEQPVAWVCKYGYERAGLCTTCDCEVSQS